MRPHRGLSTPRLALQVTFRGMPTSESVEAEIRRWAEGLDEYCDRIMSCRVTAPRSARRGGSGGADRDPVRPGRSALARRFCRSTSRYRARGRCQGTSAGFRPSPAVRCTACPIAFAKLIKAWLASGGTRCAATSKSLLKARRESVAHGPLWPGSHLATRCSESMEIRIRASPPPP